MRKSVILGCLAALGACSAKSGASKETADTTIVAGPPAVIIPPAESTPATHQPSPAAKSTPGTSAAGAVDSTRGIVSVVGTSFEKRVMIAAPGGHRTEITGTLSALVGHLAGADVTVVGNVSGTTLAATSFLVRTVDGAPAIDGTLKSDGSSLYITTLNGTRTRIVTPPPALLGHEGARVWITGDPSKGVASFGFIDPPR